MTKFEEYVNFEANNIVMDYKAIIIIGLTFVVATLATGWGITGKVKRGYKYLALNLATLTLDDLLEYDNREYVALLLSQYIIQLIKNCTPPFKVKEILKQFELEKSTDQLTLEKERFIEMVHKNVLQQITQTELIKWVDTVHNLEDTVGLDETFLKNIWPSGYISKTR